MTHDLSDLDVFFGDLSVAAGQVYARLPRPVEAGLSLAGLVRGPRCLLAETLAASSPLVDLGPGPTLLARGILPDPCFWSPDLPAIYDVSVELRRGTETLATAQREIGLRTLGVRRRSLVLDGKPWTLRGVSAAATIAALPRQWREAAACYVTASIGVDRLAEASQWGAMTIVDLRSVTAALQQPLRELAQQPAVALVVLPEAALVDDRVRSAAPNLLFAQAVNGDAEIRSWAQLLWLENAAADAAAHWARRTALPQIAVRPLATPLPLIQARGACDALQRDLAPAGQFAGYIV